MEDSNKISSEIVIPHQQSGLNRAGRPPGAINRATADAKAAIGLYVENNIERLQDWLDMIANGYEIIEIDAEGKETKKRVHPNPAQAYDLFMKVVEYHVPKLTRSDVIKTVNHKGDYELRAQTAEEAAREYHDLMKQ